MVTTSTIPRFAVARDRSTSVPLPPTPSVASAPVRGAASPLSGLRARAATPRAAPPVVMRGEETVGSVRSGEHGVVEVSNSVDCLAIFGKEETKFCMRTSCSAASHRPNKCKSRFAARDGTLVIVDSKSKSSIQLPTSHVDRLTVCGRAKLPYCRGSRSVMEKLVDVLNTGHGWKSNAIASTFNAIASGSDPPDLDLLGVSSGSPPKRRPPPVYTVDSDEESGIEEVKEEDESGDEVEQVKDHNTGLDTPRTGTPGQGPITMVGTNTPGVMSALSQDSQGLVANEGLRPDDLEICSQVEDEMDDYTFVNSLDLSEQTEYLLKKMRSVLTVITHLQRTLPSFMLSTRSTLVDLASQTNTAIQSLDDMKHVLGQERLGEGDPSVISVLRALDRDTTELRRDMTQAGNKHATAVEELTDEFEQVQDNVSAVSLDAEEAIKTVNDLLASIPKIKEEIIGTLREEIVDIQGAPIEGLDAGLIAKVNDMWEHFNAEDGLQGLYRMAETWADELNGPSGGPCGKLRARFTTLEEDVNRLKVETRPVMGEQATTPLRGSSRQVQETSVTGSRIGRFGQQRVARLSESEVSLEGLQASHAALERKIAALEGLVEDLTRNRQGGHSAGGYDLPFGTPSAGDDPQPDLQTLMDEIRSIKARKKSVSIGGISFGSQEDVIAWVIKNCEGDPDVGLVSDMITILLGADTGNTKTLKDETDAQVQAKRLKRDIVQNRVITSYKLQTPSVFIGNGKITTEHPLPAIKTYKDWADSTGGVRHRIAKEIDKGSKSFEHRVKLSSFTVSGQSYLRSVRSFAKEQWSGVADFLTTNYNTIRDDYGVDEQEAWHMSVQYADKIFELGAGIRSAAQDLPNEIDERARFAVFLWTSLQFASLLKEIAGDDYVGHHSMINVKNEHIMKNRVTPKAFKKVKDQVASVNTLLHASVTNLRFLFTKGGHKLPEPMQGGKKK